MNFHRQSLSRFTSSLMLCLGGVNDSRRNEMKNELYYGQLLRNFIPSYIPFLTSCARYHIFNLRWNAPFSPILNFFTNLIIAILHSLKFFPKLPSYLYQFQVFLLIAFHSSPFSPTKHNIRVLRRITRESLDLMLSLLHIT